MTSALETASSHVEPPLGWGIALTLAAVSGFLYSAAYPPLDLWPLAFVSLVPLFVALHRRSPRDALLLGGFHGFALNVSGSMWLPGVIRTFGELPWAVCAFIGLLFCAYNGGRPALFAWLSARATRNGWLLGAPAVVAFAASEAVYPQLFPFFAGGQVNTAPLLMQLAEIGGPILVGVPIVLANVALAEPLWARLDRRSLDRRRLAWALAGPAVMLVFGAWRFLAVQAEMAAAPKVSVGIVQANTPHEGLPLRDALVAYRTATIELLAKGAPDLVVWPETALSGVVGGDRLESVVREATDDPHAPSGRMSVPLLTGTFIRRGDTLTNSAVLFANNRVQGVYDKLHPLAFGEYVPFGDRFPKIYDWIPNAGHLAFGTSEAPLVLGEHRITPLICYEDVLGPDANRVIAQADPDLLVNLTNDSWFGDSAVARIHLALAKMRAIEHRRYLVRAANSGISGVVDPLGRTSGETPLLQKASEVETVRWMRSKTIYERLGDAPWWLAVVAAVWMAAFRRRPREER